MRLKSKKRIRKVVREGYARIAKKEMSCCSDPSCCGGASAKDISKGIGYTEEELGVLPEGANLGLGCGNPVALASLKRGETVLDLGSGAGIDCFLAAKRVGSEGKVIGVDMTPEMIEKARENAKNGKFRNVEFRLGEIEKLPVEDESVDVIVSNCVINLSPEKDRVFREAFRVLRPGGRMMISDIVLLKELPDFVKNYVEAYVGCLSGAIMKKEYLKTIKSAGFNDVKVLDETHFPVEFMANDPTAKAIIKNMSVSPEEAKKIVNDIANSVVSIKVYGVKTENVKI